MGLLTYLVGTVFGAFYVVRGVIILRAPERFFRDPFNRLAWGWASETRLGAIVVGITAWMSVILGNLMFCVG
jgi:hypothetical protein